ncbi:acyltransferase [Sphingomonas sp. ABOLD]|uniref:Acetyltransferase-like isoleucine patch superfamily enzyme n=1 Tax=Sphingomonas trueperi TaxID=53317 RepID=A0A7X5XXL7_9SPHN|nr:MULTISPECIES: acyltransferase [Sphingomonas]NJB96957.1 acetyltransferase-like isoleucine patch superfamily enzyme [Sphingomonas trueperi]RSV42873.1 acyltransferase [Sphingomonas sp. ABOLE]RSV50860.1 acyltransferase [Sphingomonas sp. ABOLD]
MFARIWRRFVRTRIWGMDIHPSAVIADSALIDRTFPKGVHIAARAVIGEQAVVLTHDIATRVWQHTYIGEGATLGARAIVLPGLKVGKGAVVLPGSVVTEDVPDGATVRGNPGKLIAPSSYAA